VQKSGSAGGPYVTSVPDAAQERDFLVLDEGDDTLRYESSQALELKPLGICAPWAKADVSTTPIPSCDLLDLEAYLEMSRAVFARAVHRFNASFATSLCYMAQAAHQKRRANAGLSCRLSMTWAGGAPCLWWMTRQRQQAQCKLLLRDLDTWLQPRLPLRSRLKPSVDVATGSGTAGYAGRCHFSAACL
jgi:hypothetical protein